MNWVKNTWQSGGQTSRCGFTLVELLIVIAIIGVLSALLFSNFTGARERARDTKRKSDLMQIKNALRLWYNDFQRYPDTGGVQAGGVGTTLKGCGTSTSFTDCSWGETFINGSTVYMNEVPKDPVNDAANYYTYQQGNALDSTSNAFQLTTILENISDPDSAVSQSKCGIASPQTGVYVVCSD
ncbi:MAG: General secretion pathway protein G [Microgenomates group bacterium GW2011_GWA1_46_15]|nr:MAG: General secretion pathway protein G [Microgenomates group bacterium GW2011_GWB1_45_17]KKU23068.1 MAG: General secretion pathway protein G [Microgenomates group bacterium GW2011_GWA1_46_15]KKU23729.1 MAG: hypothetical protein UX36_C0003G0029 [Microgenomates group bacterium GW2011_GWC1_46_15]